MFFLDGSRHVNTARSDCCMGWMLKQIKAELEDDAEDEDGTAEANT